MRLEEFVSERELAQSPATRLSLRLLRHYQPILRWIIAPLIAFPLGVIAGRWQRPAPVVSASPPAPALPALTPLAAPKPPPAAPPVEVPNTTTDETGVRRVLGEYATALEDLDVNAAVRVWPSVDRRSLARRFSTVSSQTLIFERCDVKAERSSAVAQCRGKLRYVSRRGPRTPRVEPYQWQFRMRKAASGWMIDRVAAARVWPGAER